MRTNHHAPALWPGLLLVALGTGLIARELGFLPQHVRVLDFWPLLIVVLGMSVLLRAGGIASAVLALAFIASGGVLLAGNLGFLSSSVTRLWPVLLVLLGLWALFRGARGPHRRGPSRWRPPEGSPPGEVQTIRAVDEDRLSRQYTASGAELRIESQAWKGGELGVTAGGVELDLRQAQLDPDGAVLVLRVVMGGVEIRVPDTWHVQFDVMPFIGGADDSTRSTQGTTSAPRLRITGTVTLGGVSVSN